MRTVVRTSIVALALACCASACAQPGCVIKDNISSSGERIYHMPGQRYSDKTRIDLRTKRGTLVLHRARGCRCPLAKSEGLTLSVCPGSS